MHNITCVQSVAELIAKYQSANLCEKPKNFNFIELFGYNT